VDPIELWTTPPFEPSLRDGRLYARGAQDNKGQVFYFFKALEALIQTGAPLPTIKVLLEGEEECGSVALRAGVHGWGEKLKADVMMVCDTGMVAPGVPTITMGLRGIADFELKVHGPRTDLHSGVFGGVVLNPIRALVQIIAALYNTDGSIAVPGFYDGVEAPEPEDRKLANSAPLDLGAISAALGVPFTGGEKLLPPLERRGFRPTLELNGIGGGYQGAGGKTVIPSVCMAKFSLRLVKGQDPLATLEKVTSYIRSIVPEGVRVEIPHQTVGGSALQLSTKSENVQRATRAIQNAFSREPVFLWEGASVPIIPELAAASGSDPILVGFGLEEDQIHAPNESFSIDQFQQGYRFVTSFLSQV
jgi:acetylornithine deacetylase/succinyl-diaminopimelate desuccinylase-like protein